MYHGRYSDRIFTRRKRSPRKREAVVPAAVVKQSRFTSFIRRVFRGKVKV